MSYIGHFCFIVSENVVRMA